MAKITFDPELMGHIKTIYGDNELDGRALKQIHQTWQQNPGIIRNTARQASARSPIQQQPVRPTAQPVATPRTLVPRRQDPQMEAPEAQDDLRGISGFGAAFKEARRRGLKQFRWSKGVYGTQLAAGASSGGTQEGTGHQGATSKRKATVEIGPVVMTSPQVRYLDNGRRAVVSQSDVNDRGGITQNRSEWIKPPTTNMYGEELTPEQIKNSRSWEPVAKTRVRYQQGGTMNNQEELQKAFLAFLIQDAAAQGVQLQSEQDLQAYAEQLGEEGIKAKYQEFMQKMQGGAMARLGAKLEYYRKLKGVCPEGQELVFFKQGGRICKACQKKADKVEKGKKMNAVEEFKSKRKNMKDVKSNKCGSKMKR